MTKSTTSYPYLLTRGQASAFLGIDPKSFDKFIRSNDNLGRFMIGKQERYTLPGLTQFIQEHLV